MRARLLFGAVLALASGCATGPSVSSLNELQDARDRWNRLGIATYSVTVRWVCFCGEVRPVRVRVEAGVVTSRVFVGTTESVPASMSDQYPAIPGLFDRLEAAIYSAHQFQATYDAELGIPREASIDYVANAVDDEKALTVSDFSRG